MFGKLLSFILHYLAGYLGPIDTPLYINCNAIRNFQFQFPVPENWQWNPQYWPGLGQHDFDARSLTSENAAMNYEADSSRKVAYKIIENVLNREGKNGRACMLRAICEVAETPVNHDENGIIGEFMQVFFTPGEFESIDIEYRDAQSAGRNHVNCERMFAQCPMGHGILDSFSLIREFGLVNWATRM